MTILRVITVAIVVSMLVSVLVRAQDQERKIKRSDLPPAVEKAVVAQSQGATIRGFSQERENGKTLYEADLMVGGRSKDILIDADGAVVEVEQQVRLQSLSPSVRNGLQAKAGGGKLVKVESLTKRGKLVAYEAQVVTSGKRFEIQVGPEGEPLTHEE
jgi:hypothetical protein